MVKHEDRLAGMLCRCLGQKPLVLLEIHPLGNHDKRIPLQLEGIIESIGGFEQPCRLCASLFPFRRTAVPVSLVAVIVVPRKNINLARMILFCTGPHLFDRFAVALIALRVEDVGNVAQVRHHIALFAAKQLPGLSDLGAAGLVVLYMGIGHQTEPHNRLFFDFCIERQNSSRRHRT